MEGRKVEPIELNRVEDVLLHLKEIIPISKEENPHLAPEVRLESYLAFHALNDLMKNMWHNAKKLVSKDSLYGFMLFLERRYHMIKNTNSIYCLCPESKINVVCYELANIIQSVLGIHAFNLMMLDLPQANRYYLHDKIFAQAKWQDFILSDDGLPISILGTLLLKENEFSLRYDERLVYQVDLNGQKYLTPSEHQRLLSYSEEVRQYCSDVRKNPENILEYQEVLKEKFAGKSMQIESSYGVEGARRLKKNIISQIKLECNDIFDIVKLLGPALTASEITHFLRELQPNELFALTIRVYTTEKDDLNKINRQLHDIFEKILANLEEYAEDNTDYTIRVLLVIVGEVYHCYRSCLPDYTSNIALIGSYLPGTAAYSKKERLDAFECLNNFYCGGFDLSDLKTYFEKNELSRHWKPLTESSWKEPSLLSLLTTITMTFGEKLKEKEILNQAVLRPGLSGGLKRFGS